MSVYVFISKAIVHTMLGRLFTYLFTGLFSLILSLAGLACVIGSLLIVLGSLIFGDIPQHDFSSDWKLWSTITGATVMGSAIFCVSTSFLVSIFLEIKLLRSDKLSNSDNKLLDNLHPCLFHAIDSHTNSVCELFIALNQENTNWVRLMSKASRFSMILSAIMFLALMLAFYINGQL